jgi:Na+-transporting methylmalonyl-CoA/oxaloacetate decarboxylase gamma subunit
LDNPLGIALLIAAVGMSLLFLSLAFFYGLLSFLTATVKDQPASPAQQAAGRDQGKAAEDKCEEEEPLLRAAAVAIALARAEAEVGHSLAATPAMDGTPGGQPVSPWWSLHHQRQMSLEPSAWRRR